MDSKEISSTVQRLQEESKQREKQLEISKEFEEEYRKAVQKIFDSPEGVLFGQVLVQKLSVFSSKSGVNQIGMIEENATRAVYLKLIRPYLDKQQKIKLECEQ